MIKCYLCAWDIRLLESEGNYTRLYFGSINFALRTLASMEERLTRRTLFALPAADTLLMRICGQLRTDVRRRLNADVLPDGTKVEMSRRQAQKFREDTMI